MSILFLVNNTALVFDLFVDSLLAFGQKENKLTSVSLQAIKDLDPKKIIQNQETPSSFYAITENKGIFSLHSIDLLSGRVSKVFNLAEFNFPKNIKVIDDWVYFIRPTQTGFNKLYRVDIDKK